MKLLFDITISRATSCRSMLRTAKTCASTSAEIVEQVRGSPLVKVDETGWKVSGHSHWLHVLVTEEAVLYRIDPRRSHQVLADVIGLDDEGTLTHDGLASYGRFKKSFHQQ
jgi:transposase